MGVAEDPPRQAFRRGRHDLVAANGGWLLDGRISGEKFPQPVGLAELPDMVVVASSASLYIYGKDGALIDRLEKGALPGAPVQAIGSDAHQLVLRTASGTFESADALSWMPTPRERELQSGRSSESSTGCIARCTRGSRATWSLSIRRLLAAKRTFARRRRSLRSSANRSASPRNRAISSIQR